ncbi:probable serine/threonine-protein kinase PBL28 [Lolium perenne]|uniref:probable serine/threonine-protein kinase PBL28 n=1 Tax=Lolium perenne TaxID=4522 RepID=UPI0021F5D23E|nr:putative serine/threonine-protein kinase-like protein CCR3 [Lolium perenne]XP_051228586.1 putative serine/threonine-protein kinase-like protein CCR3 [Lolium perenne]
MALWTGLGQAATVAQLVGADVGGLISMIMQAALTARQNRKECEQLARRVLMIAQLLPHVQDPEAAQQLAGLGDTLRDAHELVVSCQGRSAAYQLVMAGRQAESFREVQRKIEFYLIIFPVISHIGITRRLEQIYKVLVQDDSTSAEPSQLPQSSQLQKSTKLGQEIITPGIQEFTFAEIMAATNNFSLDTIIGEGGFGTVYRGRLHDGQEVAVKRMKNLQSRNLKEEFYTNTFRENYGSSNLQEEFQTELDILSRLPHKHIIRLLGSCVTVSKDKLLQDTTQKKKKGLLTRRRKEPEEPERLIVYEYMQNGTLFDHLHCDHGISELSPVTLSWAMRINVLLGVSRAVEHLHSHARPPIIHRDTKSANILFDANWVPHLSDFGSSVAWDTAVNVSEVVGTVGYMAPEYMARGHLSPMIDVYSLGVVMLEVLTGEKAVSQERKFGGLHILTDFLDRRHVSIVPDFLDRRPVPEPTPWQLQALKRVAWTARCCVKLDVKDRLAISDVVTNLEMAHEWICRDEPGSVHDAGLVEEFSDSPHNSPRSNSVSSAGFAYQSDLESEVLEEGR